MTFTTDTKPLQISAFNWQNETVIGELYIQKWLLFVHVHTLPKFAFPSCFILFYTTFNKCKMLRNIVSAKMVLKSEMEY